MLEYCRIYMRLEIKKEKKDMSQDPPQRTAMVTFHFKGARSATHK